MELIPSLHLIEGGRSNIYLWLGDGGPLLVDAGMPGDRAIIERYLQDIGVELASIAAIFVTHTDLDHVGSLSRLQAKSGAKVYASAEATRLLTKGKSPRHMPWLVQLFIDVFMKYKPVSIDAIRTVEDNEEFQKDSDWRVIATPGHTMDHIAYYSVTNGILFAGDALNTRDNQLGSTPKRITADWGEAVQSAKRLLVLHPAVIACGHGRPFVNHEAAAVLMLYRELEKL